MTFTVADRLQRQAQLTGLRQTDGDDVGVPLGSAGLQLSAMKPLPTELRDSVARPSWTANLDTENRVSAGKAAAALGWAPGSRLIARVDRSGLVPVVTVGAGPIRQPHEHRVTLDSAGRLRRAPTVLGALGLQPKAQLMLSALPARGVLVLFALDDVVPLITNALFPVPPVASPSASEPEQAAPPVGRTNVRPMFRPDEQDAAS